MALQRASVNLAWSMVQHHTPKKEQACVRHVHLECTHATSNHVRGVGQDLEGHPEDAYRVVTMDQDTSMMGKELQPVKYVRKTWDSTLIENYVWCKKECGSYSFIFGVVRRHICLYIWSEFIFHLRMVMKKARIGQNNKKIKKIKKNVLFLSLIHISEPTRPY